MRFCDQCQSVMKKDTTHTGAIVFTCRCQYSVDGQPDDTLMAEEYMETSQGNLKHEVFIENAPYDPAGNVVFKDCPQCGLNFMIMIRIGVQETVMYVCSCNYRATNEEYMKHIQMGGEKISTVPEKNEKQEKKE